MAGTIAFGDFVLDTDRRRLLKAGRPVALGQRALAVLEALAEAQGRTMGKDELLARAWPDAIVEEGNLTAQIALLRKALGQAEDGQGSILTVPRVGYRLVGQASSPTAPRVGEPAVAVLPFRLLGDPADRYFADGVVADIVSALSRFRSFAVVTARGEAAGDPRGVARDLGVRYLLTGSVRRAGEQLRITADLVDGESGAELWARSFDGTLGDVFAFQDRITEEVVTLVEPRIQAAEIERSRRERPGSVATYDISLRALAKISSEAGRDNAEAFALLELGLAAEPDNAMLLGLAAWALEHRHTMGWAPLTADDVGRCGELARRGLELSGGDAMVMAHCGMALMQTVKDYEWALALLEAAAEANPNNLMVMARAAVAQLHCGDLDACLRNATWANRLSPGEHGAHCARCIIAHVHLIRRDDEEALRWAGRALASNPNFDPALWIQIAANAHLGRMDEARRGLERLHVLSPGVTVARIQAGQPAKDPSRVEALLAGLRLAGLTAG